MSWQSNRKNDQPPHHSHLMCGAEDTPLAKTIVVDVLLSHVPHIVKTYSSQKTTEQHVEHRTYIKKKKF